MTAVRSLIVGVIVPPAKELIWADLLSDHPSTEIRYVFPSDDHFSSADALLTKVSDFHSRRNRVFAVLSEFHSAVPVVATIESQRAVADRLSMMLAIQLSNERIATPRTVLVDAASFPDLFEGTTKWIMKTRTACGPKWGHRMALVDSPVDARKFINSGEFPPETEFVLQQFIPHDGWFIKMFIVGARVFAFKRPSIDGSVGGTEFSASMFKKSASIEIPVSDTLRHIALGLTEIFRFDLFGADLVENSDTGELLVIDVNYFPTFSELGSKRKQLIDEYLLDKFSTARTSE